MKILVQSALRNPTDYFEIDSSRWGSLPKKLEPSKSDTVDGDLGWVNSLCVQGVEFAADHYAVEDLIDGAVKVTVWNDDADDRPLGERYAREWIFHPCSPDEKCGGAWNTRQFQIFYAESAVLSRSVFAQTTGGEVEFKDWSEFVSPREEVTRHGVWTSKHLHAKHITARRAQGWREWTEDIPKVEIVDDRIRPQRDQGRYIKPVGTRTYFASTTVLANGAHAAIQSNDELQFDLATGSASTQVSGSVSGGVDGIAFTFVTPANQPNSTAWPTGNYRWQIDCSSVGAAITYGCLDQGGSSGHFARTNAAIDADQETKQQAEGAFSGTGLNIASTGSVSWSSGSASDRWEAVLTIARPTNHGNQSITLQLNESDDFTDGPWLAAAAPADNPPFFGANF